MELVFGIQVCLFFLVKNIDDLRFNTFLRGGEKGNDQLDYKHVKNQLMKKKPGAELFSKTLIFCAHLIKNW